MSEVSTREVSVDLLDDDETVRVDITFVDPEAAASFIKWFCQQLDAGKITFGGPPLVEEVVQ